MSFWLVSNEYAPVSYPLYREKRSALKQWKDDTFEMEGIETNNSMIQSLGLPKYAPTQYENETSKASSIAPSP